MFHTDNGQYREFIDRLFQVNLALLKSLETDDFYRFRSTLVIYLS